MLLYAPRLEDNHYVCQMVQFRERFMARTIKNPDATTIAAIAALLRCSSIIRQLYMVTHKYTDQHIALME